MSSPVPASLDPQQRPSADAPTGAAVQRTPTGAIARAGQAGLTANTAAVFANESEKRRRIVDAIGFGGTTLSSVLFVAPLAGIMIPSAIPIGLVAGCLAVYVAGRSINGRHDRRQLKALGLTTDEIDRALGHFLRARAKIPNGALGSARNARLARALLEQDETL